jgi:hypothetical protein
MKIPLNCKLEACVSNDTMRLHINNIHIDVENKLAIATNGQMLAIVPIEPEEADTSGPLPPKALQAARKLKAFGAACFTINGDIKLPDGCSMPRPTVSPYPNWRAVVPAEDRPVKFAVSLDAKLLSRLADALGSDVVKLQFLDDLSPIVVVPSGCLDGRKGILMPERQS